MLIVPTRPVYNAKRFCVGAHVVINYAGVPSPAAPRSCGSELAREEASADTKNRASGQSLSRASSLPQKPVYNAKRFSVGAHVVINYGGVPSPAAHRSCGSELAREEASAATENRASGQSLSRASSLPQDLCTTPSASALGRMSSSTTAACRLRQRIGPVGASLLAKRPVQPQKTGRLDNRFREQARSHKNLCTTPSALALGRMSSSTTPACRPRQHIGPVGASLLAKRPVQPQKTGRLDNRFREQARSHKICVQRQALQRGGACRHQIRRCAVSGSASVLWERACSRRGQCRHKKQGVWTIAFASKLAPTRFVYNAKRFGVGRMSSSNMSVCRLRQRIGPVGASLLANRPVQPQKTGRLDNRFREQARSHKICVQRQALQRWGACLHQICRCAAPACRCGKWSVPCGNSFLRKLPSW